MQEEESSLSNEFNLANSIDFICVLIKSHTFSSEFVWGASERTKPKKIRHEEMRRYDNNRWMAVLKSELTI